MDKKISFTNFVCSNQGILGASLSFGAGFSIYIFLSDVEPIKNYLLEISFATALVFFISYAIGFIRAYNKKINKNIKDRESEK